MLLVYLYAFMYRILNKLTPDNFEKLSFELARHAGINNKEILKGAIFLVSTLFILLEVCV